MWLAGTVLASALAVAAATQPNPPTWPDTVQVFTPSMSAGDIEAAVNAAYATNGGQTPPNNGQFSSSRFAFMFMPGKYTSDVPVGFYTSVYGLGATPQDTVFAGDKGVYCEEGDTVYSGGALDTFWRNAENFQTMSNHKWNVGTGMLWATSQATPLRRVVVDNDLLLYQYVPPYQEAGFSSGGYISNSEVSGTVFSGSQQQYFARNTNVGGGWNGGVWNMVFEGCPGAPSMHCSNVNGGPFTTIDSTSSIAEKPFLTADASGKFYLNVPALRTDAVGPDYSAGDTRDFSNVYVANNVTDNADTINAALSSGLDVVLTGGTYHLSTPLKVNNPNQVLMGVGWPTLVPTSGNPVVYVGDAAGVRIAGPMLLQAGAQRATTLLQVGDLSDASPAPGDPTNPVVIQDVFARVGGPDAFDVSSEYMFNVTTGNVIIDDTWLWRADHTVSGLVRNGANLCNHALVVTGENVSAHGLAAEHTLGDNVLWLGDGGATYFYQSEIAYDVNQTWGALGNVGYRVGPSVTSHKGYGIGVYQYFRDFAVVANTAMIVPDALVSSIVNPVAVFLNGKGTIQHVINDLGASTSFHDSGGFPAWYCAA